MPQKEPAEGGGIRLADTLKPGLTYSVVSYRPEFDPDHLRRESSLYPEEVAGRYLQLPPTVSQRTRQLARRRNLRPRQPGDTLAEYARRAGQLPGLTHLTHAAEIGAYRPETPEKGAVAAARQALAALKGELSGQRSRKAP